MPSFVGLIEHFIWQPLEALFFIFALYYAEHATDLLTEHLGGRLTRLLTLRKCLRVFYSCLGAAMLLAIATNAARYNPSFCAWLPQTMYFTILSGLILLILKRLSQFGVINPVVSQVMQGRITSIIANETVKDRIPSDTEGVASH